jgi:hypothetical protein
MSPNFNLGIQKTIAKVQDRKIHHFIEYNLQSSCEKSKTHIQSSNVKTVSKYKKPKGQC